MKLQTCLLPAMSRSPSWRSLGCFLLSTKTKKLKKKHKAKVVNIVLCCFPPCKLLLVDNFECIVTEGVLVALAVFNNNLNVFTSQAGYVLKRIAIHKDYVSVGAFFDDANFAIWVWIHPCRPTKHLAGISCRALQSGGSIKPAHSMHCDDIIRLTVLVGITKHIAATNNEGLVFLCKLHHLHGAGIDHGTLHLLTLGEKGDGFGMGKDLE
mmetsp:Transcript_34351/g.75577  ORF Transcript_34351/g.75577 Transcript_34351/m.75577 type:complete len:210 (+) Transcript_34351:3-632(+)